jgi:phage host-nuclease inhibitor protein Gam
MARTRTLTPNLPVPQDREACRDAIREIGQVSRELARLQADHNDRVAELRGALGAQAQPLKDRLTALHEGVRVFCEANRDALTEGGRRKHFDFVTGRVAWRHRPPSVTLRGKEGIVERLLEAGGRFLRTRHEVDREAMLADPEAARAIPGVAIGSAGEDFVVEAHEDELEEAR